MSVTSMITAVCPFLPITTFEPDQGINFPSFFGPHCGLRLNTMSFSNSLANGPEDGFKSRRKQSLRREGVLVWDGLGARLEGTLRFPNVSEIGCEPPIHRSTQEYIKARLRPGPNWLVTDNSITFPAFWCNVVQIAPTRSFQPLRHLGPVLLIVRTV